MARKHVSLKLSNHVDSASHREPTYPEAPEGSPCAVACEKAPKTMTTQRDKMREDVQVRILRLLQDNPEMSQRELAKAVGVSTVAFTMSSTRCWKGADQAGQFHAAEDKRRYAYVLTPKGISAKAG